MDIGTQVRKLITIALVTLLTISMGCDGGNGGTPDAELIDNIITTQLTGTADDGDSTSPPDRYTGPDNLDAVDERTKASSIPPQFNRVAGSAEAEPFDPAAETVTDDEARAFSANKVVSRLVVNRAGRFTFDVDLDVRKVELRHDGTVLIQAAAALLDDQGVSVPEGGITNVTFDFRRNAAGELDVVIADDEANPDSTDEEGGYRRTLSGPSGGVPLDPGNYRLELDLRITARVPVLVGDDGERHRAAVESASASIALR